MSEPTAYPQQQTTPVCPRHPDRVSYVRCQRCSRPVCPECQRPAAVGVQCVDCVKEQAKTVRTARTVFGGNVTDTPVVSYAIIAICALVFVLQTARPGVSGDISFVPYLGKSQPWRFITSAFAHATITHILFNMLALWMVGAQYLERLLGRARYAAVYLVSAIGGSSCYLLLSPAVPFDELNPSSWYIGAVGASGAVFGLFGALLVLNRHLGRSSAGMYATIGINAVIGFVVPGIAWQAHLGGLLTGAAVAGVIAATSSRETRRWQWPGVALVLLVVVAVAIGKYATAPASLLG
ncbi:membrane associated rhomboid family serine protease [Phycicoccus badiiscoriae]|uniref:Membrane associated rhomboid family serine protease n=1 Tax=Pedococcus badiiscoriae TaxID=642776 RepID=A0A852WH81_9MICO|nr:rhomboid family intramembrane serine protease [Pedococcus badiiscoriae]NYG06891.1 membrane associated rhomboid family serine protease [Pedococcus badiiscoriae]